MEERLMNEEEFKSRFRGNYASGVFIMVEYDMPPNRVTKLYSVIDDVGALAADSEKEDLLTALRGPKVDFYILVPSADRVAQVGAPWAYYGKRSVLSCPEVPVFIPRWRRRIWKND